MSRTWSLSRIRPVVVARGARLPRGRDVFKVLPPNPITPVSPQEVSAFVEAIPPPAGLEWSLALASEQDIADAAAQCHAELGVWPISFSYPKPPLPAHAPRSRLVSPIRPGAGYAFHDERAYLQAYASASFSVTHRKAGWDCFRHVEILASGSLPLMLDAHAIPEHSLVHYPKAAMRGIVEHLTRAGDTPPLWVEEAVREHFTRHLTSTAMARYLLRSCGLADAERVLFVDAQLPLSPDYQSVFALIGLTQLLGAGCVPLFPVPYVYQGAQGTGELYGRGFGYTRALPGGPPRTRWSRGLSRQLAGFDAVVVGSIARNCPLARRMLDHFPADRTIWIHGEDAAPSPQGMEFLKGSGAHVFVRSLGGG